MFFFSMHDRKEGGNIEEKGTCKKETIEIRSPGFMPGPAFFIKQEGNINGTHNT